MPLWNGPITLPRWRPRQLSVYSFLGNSNAPVYLRQIWSTTIELLLDRCLSMHVIPVLQANSRSPRTLSSEGPTKSSSATGHTATRALFLAYQVFMLDARNCDTVPKPFKQLTRNSNCLRYLIPDMRDPSIINRLRSANKFPVIFARTSRFKNSFICYALASYEWLWLVFYCVIVYCMNVHVL